MSSDSDKRQDAQDHRQDREEDRATVRGNLQDGFNVINAVDIGLIKEHITVLNSEMGETRDSIRKLDESNIAAHAEINKNVNNISFKLWGMGVLIIVMSIIGPVSITTIVSFLHLLGY